MRLTDTGDIFSSPSWISIGHVNIRVKTCVLRYILNKIQSSRKSGQIRINFKAWLPNFVKADTPNGFGKIPCIGLPERPCPQIYEGRAGNEARFRGERVSLDAQR